MSVFVNLPGRGHGQNLPPIPLPGNDATTVITVNITS
jgi:hypothetical protein